MASSKLIKNEKKVQKVKVTTMRMILNMWKIIQGMRRLLLYRKVPNISNCSTNSIKNLETSG